jgi:predicted TIM-barrel fold metal-dependent hydrolase
MKNTISITLCLALILILSSCSNKYYTMDDFKSIKKIDAHTHVETKNTALSDLAIDDNFMLLTVNTDVPGSASIGFQFEAASFLHQKFPENVNFLTTFSLEGWDSAGWADRTIEKLKSDFAHGALGVKVWKNIGMTDKDAEGHFIMIDNPKFDSVFAFIAQQDKTVLGHLGEPRNCWLPIGQMTVKSDQEYFKDHPEYHMFLHPEYPSYQSQIDARDRMLERNPNLRFVGAHLGSLEWSIDELAKRLDKFPNMAVDMAERICHLQLQSQKDREKVRQFFIKYQDRLLYGTDASIDSSSDGNKVRDKIHAIWLADWKYFVTNEKMTAPQFDGEFEGLQLPKDIVDKIYFANAEHWFKIKQTLK